MIMKKQWSDAGHPVEDSGRGFIRIDLSYQNPTLIFWGSRDSYVPLADGVSMHREI